MKLIRFKHHEDRLHWNRELVRKGEITMLRGGIYLLSEEQYGEIQNAGVETQLITREEVDRDRETA